MRAMILTKTTKMNSDSEPLLQVDLPIPEPAENEVLLKISACGVCHTELDEIEGRTPPPHFPMILGHQVVGKIAALGKSVQDFLVGERLGVAWIFSACGKCEYCLSGRENLCPDFLATGRDANGGYAEYMTVPVRFSYRIPEIFKDIEAAPLLCAGAIGYRSLHLTHIQDGDRLGLTGFGASAHLVLKLIRFKFPHTRVYVFARSESERKFALEQGAVWAGDTTDPSPDKLHAIIDTTPVWKPVVEALSNLAPGGRLVINAIRKESADQMELLKIQYPEHLWMEKEIKSVANVTREDVRDFLKIAAEIPIKPEVEVYPLAQANQALRDLKFSSVHGAKVLTL